MPDKISNQPKVLRLTLHKKWFDMIASGEKKEEYREIKPYWKKRLIKYIWVGQPPHDSGYGWVYGSVEFTNGYGKDRPRVVMEFISFERGVGKPEWGAPKEDVYIIKLGKEISRHNF